MPRKSKPVTSKPRATSIILIAFLVIGFIYLIIKVPVIGVDLLAFLNTPIVLTIIGGLIVGITILYLEYGFFQRKNKLRRKKKPSTTKKPTTNQNSTLKKIKGIFQSRTVNWNKAIDIAIVIFKDRMDKYQWIDEQISIEKIVEDKHFATFNLVITTQKFAQPVVIEKYSLRINTTGDILEMNAIPII